MRNKIPWYRTLRVQLFGSLGLVALLLVAILLNSHSSIRSLESIVIDSASLDLEASERQSQFDKTISRLNTVNLIISFVAILVIAAVALRIAERTSRIRSLSEAIHAAVDTPLVRLNNVYGRDELGNLAESMNSLTTKAGQQIDDAMFQQEQMHSLFNATADGIITIDETGVIDSLNKTAAKLFGYSVHDLIGKNVSTLAPSPHREQHDGYLRRYLRTGEAQIIGSERELEGRRKDGATFPMALRVTELRRGHDRTFIGTVQDITARKRAEAERQRLFDTIRDAVNRLSTISQSLLATTVHQANGTQQQATAVTEIVATAEELAQTAEQARQGANEMAQSARQSDDVGHAGARAIVDSIGAMRQVTDHVEHIANTILALSQQAQAIGEITASVNDISEQTNVLALNAAIEASRAGEQGKGFAVVATEVKTLAEESKRATVQVRQILSEIQQATDDAVRSTKQGTDSVAAAGAVVGEAGDTIKTLSEILAGSARTSAQILASAGQQAAGISQLSIGIRDIEEVAKQNLHAIQQIEGAAQDLNALSNELDQLTAQSTIAT